MQKLNRINSLNKNSGSISETEKKGYCITERPDTDLVQGI